MQEDMLSKSLGHSSGVRQLVWSSPGSLPRERKTLFILGHRGVFNSDWI